MATVRLLAGKGRALVAERPIKSGEVVLTEPPLLLVVDEEHLRTCCAACLRICQPGAPLLKEICLQTAVRRAPVVPPSAVKAAMNMPLNMRAGMPSTSAEDATSLRLLVHLKAAKGAAAVSQGRMPASPDQALWAVVTQLSPDSKPHPLAGELHRRLSEATGEAESLTAEEVDGLLRKEASNSYGIMAPSGPQGFRRIRGGGFYSLASLLNHDCLPNMARFDCFDASGEPGQPGNTLITFQALHDIPAGEELTASYFPLTCTYEERQQRCRDVYGFECRCLRCQEESTWSDDEDQGMRTAVESSTRAQQTGAVDTSYIDVFLLKYVCPEENCMGTLAPAASSDRYTCNMCGFTRTEADFLRELQDFE